MQNKPGASPKPARGEQSPALSSRSAALNLLQTVLRQKLPLDEALDQNDELKKLEPRDRAFVHLLVATVLRRMGQLDEAIKACLDKPQELKAKAHDLLRLGAAQLLFLGTPPHAAVDTIVSLASTDNATAPYKGLINAVLRRLSREGAALIKDQDITKTNIPAWLWLSWRQSFGVAAARQLAEACLGEAQTDITVKSDAAGWAEKMGGRLLPTGSIRLTEAVAVPSLPGFDEGAWWVQDAAAALPVLLLGSVTGQRVVDLCAAPGGKTAQLAAQGGLVTAVDRSDKRLVRLKENMTRLGFTIETHCKDAAQFVPMLPFPLVLLDAPCSATGTVRRHPDILRLKHKEDVERLAALQSRLLDHAIEKILASGGTLIYSVCSMQAAEAEDQILAALTRHPNITRKPIAPDEIAGAAEFITPEGDLRSLPHQWEEVGGIDGFFAARLVKA